MALAALVGLYLLGAYKHNTEIGRHNYAHALVVGVFTLDTFFEKSVIDAHSGRVSVL